MTFNSVSLKFRVNRPIMKLDGNGVAHRLTAFQSIPKNVLVELSIGHNKRCMFCEQKDTTDKLYGKLYQLNDIVVHYFCLLLSNTAQNGEFKEGILGFLLKDIKAELTRGFRETCVYCDKKGATISCCEVKCRKVFHLPCGLKNGSMHQYFFSFRSFCQKHRIPQTIDVFGSVDCFPTICGICKDDLMESNLPTIIWAQCCKRNSWFHRECIQNLALDPGYFFKCPLCNDVENFKCRMLTLGIYVPSRYLKKLNYKNAFWGTVPNTIKCLSESHSTCNALKCLYPFQNQQLPQHDSRSWEIILCHTCGSNKTHRLCSFMKCFQQWNCAACQATIADNAKRAKKKRLELPIIGKCIGISAMYDERVLAQMTVQYFLDCQAKAKLLKDPILNSVNSTQYKK